jgi:hypothetical protein
MICLLVGLLVGNNKLVFYPPFCLTLNMRIVFLKAGTRKLKRVKDMGITGCE